MGPHPQAALCELLVQREHAVFEPCARDGQPEILKPQLEQFLVEEKIEDVNEVVGALRV